MGEGVLEGVGALGKQAGLVEKLRRLQLRQAAVQRLVGRVGDGLQQRPGHLGANDGGGLEQAFVLRRQPIDARRQQRLHCGRHLQGVERLGQTIGTTLPDQDPGLHQGAHALLQKEGIALRAGNQELGEGHQTRILPSRPGAMRRRSPREGGRAGAGCSTSYCPSRADTPDGS